MFKNILITSLRNFSRSKSFSIINLIGLSVSMSLSMLIITIFQEQLSFDNFHKDADRIYRVNTHLHHAEWGSIDFASAPLPVGQVLKDDYSLFDNVVRVSRRLNGDATYLNIIVPVRGLFVDPSFLDVFNFPFQNGNPGTALVASHSLVLTKPTAEKIFGTRDPVGQTISMKGYGDFTITGVLQELPGKTHFDFQMLCSMSTLLVLEKRGAINPTLDNWSAPYDNYIYIKIKGNQNREEVEHALAEINQKYGKGLQSEGKDIGYNFYLQPLKKITPGPELSGKMGKGMPAFLLVFLSVLAAVVLLMSVFNFTNLTIAKSLTRAREIGVRKVVGAKRHQIFFQFIGEAVIFSLIALLFSYVLLQFLKTGLWQLSLNQNFSVDLKEDFSLYATFIVFAIAVGIMAGVLPAAYLSAFKPTSVLKDVQPLKAYSRLTFRKILMGAQFTLSFIFVMVALVIYGQMDFMLNANYGIEQKSNLTIDLQGEAFEKAANEIKALPGVVRVGGVSSRLGTWDGGSGNYQINKKEKPLAIHDFSVDDNYVTNLSLTFLAGRNFNVMEQVGREKDIILNATAIAQLGFKNPADAIGATVYADDSVMLRIIGVVKDFHFRPLNNKIGPLALRYSINKLNYLNVQIDLKQKKSTIAALTTIWKKIDPVHAVKFTMMDQEIDDAYAETGVRDILSIVAYITFLVISLSCLGMLGMAMYASKVRAKEVGIRKVMGASVTDVLLLLGKSYFILVGITITIGVPVSYVVGEIFLEGYPYRIQLTPLLFGLSIAVIAGLSLLIVWSQTISVAVANPVKWLRHE